MPKQIAIVTGATRGLGLEFVRLLAGEECLDEIWAIARRATETADDSPAGRPRIVHIACDLATRQGREHLGAQLAEEKPQIVYLINNAGIARFGVLESVSPDDIETMLTLNAVAVSALCALCLPFMARPSHIANVASAAAFLPVPYMAVYAATKAYVLRFSQALRDEVAERGIAVTVVCPGWMDTAFIATACDGGGLVPTRYYGMQPPCEVARKAWRDIRRGRSVSVCGPFAHLVRAAARLLPHGWLARIWKWQERLP